MYAALRGGWVFCLSLPLWLAASCGPIPDYRSLTEVDLHPPEFLGAVAIDARTIALRFDETVVALPESVSVAPAIGVAGVKALGGELLISLRADQRAGEAYTVEASVEDVRRNSTSLVTTCYGFNPSLPKLLINEFTTQGSGNHPDFVELLVLEGGNTAGMCLYEGVPPSWDKRKILPPIEVERGDFLVVHFKPQGMAEEVDETVDPARSGGLDATPAAYDLWVAGGAGLSGNNGVLALTACPNGTIVDAVVYSNRTSASDTDYGGFGSRTVHERVLALEEAGAWKGATGHIEPEDAVNPEKSTSTRSIARGRATADTDGASDWHITPTGGATVGSANGDEVYAP